MSGYNIYLSNGSFLTTINLKTIDQQESTSLILIGQGVPSYGTAIAQDYVWMLENFAKSSPPVNPLIGQQWFNSATGQMNVWTGSVWNNLVYSDGTASGLLGVLKNVDFTISVTHVLFTGTNPAQNYCPTKIILMPTGVFTATYPATINFSVSTAGDVIASTMLPLISAPQFVFLDVIEGARFISGAGGVLNLNITIAASGGASNYDVYVFGAGI
jgi:hypothetical protein